MHSVLVSGASRGFGLAVVARLLADGHRVGAFARTVSPATIRLQEAYGEQFAFSVADITDVDCFPSLVRSMEARIGRLTALVNNAGVVSEELLARQKPEDIDRLLNVNLRGPLMLTRQAARSMMIAGFGRIVTISSIVSVSGYKGTVAYSASKGGLNAMTRALARELGSRGITVNTIAPGYMRTDLVKQMSQGHLDQIVRRTPLGRAGTVADVTGVVAFILSDEAGFISGQTIVVDGGLSA